CVCALTGTAAPPSVLTTTRYCETAPFSAYGGYPESGVDGVERGEGFPATAAARMAPTRTRSSSGETERRSSSSLPSWHRPTTAGNSARETGGPHRSGTARDSGRLIAALGSSTPGAPPPPTAAWHATTRASTP